LVLYIEKWLKVLWIQMDYFLKMCIAFYENNSFLVDVKY
jgi:hypothetical protein